MSGFVSDIIVYFFSWSEKKYKIYIDLIVNFS